MSAPLRIEICRYGEWLTGQIIPRGIAEDAIDIDLDRPDAMGSTKVWTYVDSPNWRHIDAMATEIRRAA